MATMVATISGSTMKEVLVFIVTDYVCAIIVLIVLYPVIIKFLAKLQPLRFMKKIVEPIIVAASTTSSAATLPVSIKTAQEKLGIPENIYGFTLPPGNDGHAAFLVSYPGSNLAGDRSGSYGAE